jgi:hypothetical protein
MTLKGAHSERRPHLHEYLHEHGVRTSQISRVPGRVMARTGLSAKNGYITLANVPEGKHELHVWYERSLPEDLKGLTRVVAIASPTADLGALNVPENPNFLNLTRINTDRITRHRLLPVIQIHKSLIDTDCIPTV